MRPILTILLLLGSIVIHAQSFSVHFDFNKSAITEDARRQLDSFCVVQEQDLSRFSIQLDGHCDAIGSDAYNDRLSRQRVSAVKKYFANRGLGSLNIREANAYGERRPLNENGSEEDRRLNRRVEISYMEIHPAGMTRISSTLKETIADTATTVGTNITLRNINFVGGMHQFLKESAPMLIELLDAMNSYPNLVIRVEGHICCEEGDGDGFDMETGEYNLSAERAKAVMDYLIKNGIRSERISSKGFGHSTPLYPYPEKAPEEQRQNRRVEIKIISK